MKQTGGIMVVVATWVLVVSAVWALWTIADRLHALNRTQTYLVEEFGRFNDSESCFENGDYDEFKQWKERAR